MLHKIVNLKKNRISQLIIRIGKTPFFVPYFIITNFVFDFEIESIDNSIKLLKNNDVSLARFGDGEFNLMYLKKDIGFQNFTSEIITDLKTTIKNEDIYIGLPHGFLSTRDDKFLVKTFWWMYVTLHWKQIKKFVKESQRKTFIDASISRIITEIRNHEKIKRNVYEIREIWKHKYIIMIEGSETRFGYGNNLFDEAINVFRIIAPNVDAYAKINKIEVAVEQLIDYLSSTKVNLSRDNLIILISLGPAASILASRLDKYCKTIDIGHFDLQFEFLKKGFYKPVSINNKFDNEGVNRSKIEPISDEEFSDQIFTDLSKQK